MGFNPKMRIKPICSNKDNEHGGWKGQIPAWGRSADLIYRKPLVSDAEGVKQVHVMHFN